MIEHISTTKKRVVAILGAALIGAAIAPPVATAQTLTTLVSFDGVSAAAPYSALISDTNGNLFGTTFGSISAQAGTIFEIGKKATSYASVPAILASFDGANGANPTAGLIADTNGNLFGTTYLGGAYGNGTVFEIVKTATGYASVPNILATFDGANGANPGAGLTADSNGNLFGTTYYGGAYGNGTYAYGNGTVFEIVKTATGYAVPSILFSFDGANGAHPGGGLIADTNGNLFGTACYGGAYGNGTVFEIVKTASGYASAPTILVSFDGANGALPCADLITDTNGNLFGTTFLGGSTGSGTVFEIVKTAAGYASTPNVLVSFDGANGQYPLSGLLADTNGNLFGTTAGGGSNLSGTVFEIVKTATGYASMPIVLVTFDLANGANPSGLIADANGNLFGTTEFGGANEQGVAFEIPKTSSGYAGTPIVLASFDSTNGGNPHGDLLADANGNLFGTTSLWGPSNGGSVFEITGSGFVPPVHFAGVPGTSNCHGVSTSTLAHTYGGISGAAKALGYTSVANLQSAIAGYCGN